MCTVSWLPEAGGYTVCFNRDERFTRAPALPPSVREADGIPYVAPLDGDFGGTWLAVNRFGVLIGVLNSYGVPEYVAPPSPRSRGRLVLDLVSAPTASEARVRLQGLDLSMVQPFTLVLVEPRHPVLLAGWDGTRLTWAAHANPGFVTTSSSVTEPEVAEARRATFAALDHLSAEALAAVHQSHLPERGRCSVCMHRDDAETQSYSQVSVSPDEVRFRYVPDAPCRGTALPSVALARYPAATPSAR